MQNNTTPLHQENSLEEPELIPLVNIKSGEKFKNEQGILAIKNGIKASTQQAAKKLLKKPSWLKIKLNTNDSYNEVKNIVKQHRLSTVCEEAMCPNISECWSAGTATIMLMGDTCTRACKFCSVNTGNPQGWLDAQEPENTAKSVQLMQLKYVVLTSVDRDDLADGGANHYAETISCIKKFNPATQVEALTPDFQGSLSAIETIVASGVAVFAQNVETVKRLTSKVRDPRASYEQTLKVLAHAKKYKPSVLTKTSLMLGLGETDSEIKQTLIDLKQAKVDIVTFGQYLQPTANHIAVARYVPPEKFVEYRQWGLGLGFLEVVSGAFVRSSYRAEQVLQKDNVGLVT